MIVWHFFIFDYANTTTGLIRLVDGFKKFEMLFQRFVKLSELRIEMWWTFDAPGTILTAHEINQRMLVIGFQLDGLSDVFKRLLLFELMDVSIGCIKTDFYHAYYHDDLKNCGHDL